MQAIPSDGMRQRPLLAAPVWLASSRRLGHAGLVMTLSLFIILGPAVGQIFGRHSALLREWIMFSGSGIGVLKGHFVLHQAGEADRSMTPLELLGLRSYPEIPANEFSRLVYDVGDLKRDASSFCGSQAAGSRLSFEGWVGTRQGWRPLAVEDVCALPEPAAREPSSGTGPLL